MSRLLNAIQTGNVRLLLFCIWLGWFLLYEFTILVHGWWATIGFELIIQAMVQVGSPVLPVLTILIGKILVRGETAAPSEVPVVNVEQRVVILSITILLHLCIYAVMIVTVVGGTYGGFEPSTPYPEAVSNLCFYMLVVWVICAAPVEFITGRK